MEFLAKQLIKRCEVKKCSDIEMAVNKIGPILYTTCRNNPDTLVDYRLLVENEPIFLILEESKRYGYYFESFGDSSSDHFIKLLFISKNEVVFMRTFIN
jgi:hypothetical protein